MTEDPSGAQKKPVPFSGPSPSGTPESREPLTKDVDPTVFRQEETGNPARLLTPEARGQTIAQRPGQTSERREVGSQEHSIKDASEAYTLEPRDRRNEKKAETK